MKLHKRVRRGVQRNIIRLCLLLLAVPLFAADPVDPATASLASWKGKHTNQLFAEFGKPHKARRDGKNGKVLVYRLRFYGSEVVGATTIRWSEAGIGPTLEHQDDRRDPASATGPRLSFAGGLAVIATQKVKFYVDAQGIVQREEYGPRKWKKRRD